MTTSAADVGQPAPRTSGHSKIAVQAAPGTLGGRGDGALIGPHDGVHLGLWEPVQEGRTGTPAVGEEHGAYPRGAAPGAPHAGRVEYGRHSTSKRGPGRASGGPPARHDARDSRERHGHRIDPLGCQQAPHPLPARQQRGLGPHAAMAWDGPRRGPSGRRPGGSATRALVKSARLMVWAGRSVGTARRTAASTWLYRRTHHRAKPPARWGLGTSSSTAGGFVLQQPGDWWVWVSAPHGGDRR